jgi:hypothetical protein
MVQTRAIKSAEIVLDPGTARIVGAPIPLLAATLLFLNSLRGTLLLWTAYPTPLALGL